MPRNHKDRQQEALHEVESGSTFRNDGRNAPMHFLAIAQFTIPLATCLAIFLLSSQTKHHSTEFAKQVARNVAPCNIPDYETRIFKISSLRDKLHSVTVPLISYVHVIS